VTTWSAPVRYAEVDGQGVVFNAHYLLYCDEAMAAFCRARDLLWLADASRVVATQLHWTSSARWGDLVAVDAGCTRVGRTSFTLGFTVRVGDRVCCQVETTYVLTDDSERPTAIGDEVRTALSS
jgi:acyl-CoA thioester hydrolase